MEKQLSFTDIEYAGRKKTTKREEFLKKMDEIIPWEKWVELIRPHYPKGKRGRPVRGIETMLRMYLMQIWFSLSDEGIEVIREDDTVVYADSGYLGVPKQEAVVNDEHLSSIEYRINKRPSSLKITDAYNGFNWDKEIEHRQSSVRCKVEHAFLIVKRDFGYRKTADISVFRMFFKNFAVIWTCSRIKSI